jgi:hypothetical protein
MRTVFNIVFRIVSSLLGLIMIAMGSVWFMQAIHMGPAVIMRGFMVGNPHWALYGAILMLFGIGQVVWSNTRQ